MDWRWLVVMAGAAALYFLFQRAEQRRSNAYRAHCRAHGYGFVETSEQGYHGLAPIFLDMSQASDRHRMFEEWRYVITGQYNGASFTAFEYRSAEQWFDSTRPYWGRPAWSAHAVLLWELPDAQLPMFVVVPESVWKRFAEVLRQKQNIRFPDDPAFSHSYRLQGDDEAAVRGLFAPALRAHLAAHGMLHLTGFRHQVVWWREARLPSAAELPGFLAEGDAIRRLFFTPGLAVPPTPSA